ncbi:MAG: hypothetical protein FWD34_06500 [Oscillospiraceae bacterium]|nr:hypothetical protein [Oscillospiraceae bacterium]
MNKTITENNNDTIQIQRIEQLRYCHERLDELKSSVYQRTSIIMAILAFIVTAYSFIIIDVWNNGVLSSDSFSSTNQFIVVVSIVTVLFLAFLSSFLLTAFWGIKCLLPGKNIKTIAELAGQSKDPRVIKAFTAPIYVGNAPLEVLEKEAYDLDTLEKITNQILVEMHGISKITNQRYSYTRYSYIWLSVNIFSFALTVLFHFVLKLFWGI